MYSALHSLNFNIPSVSHVMADISYNWNNEVRTEFWRSYGTIMQHLCLNISSPPSSLFLGLFSLSRQDTLHSSYQFSKLPNLTTFPYAAQGSGKAWERTSWQTTSCSLGNMRDAALSWSERLATHITGSGVVNGTLYKITTSCPLRLDLMQVVSI